MREESDQNDELWLEEDLGNMVIYEGKNPSLEAAQAIRIALDGKPRSSMDWSIEIKQAKEWIDQGFRIFWDLNLGLFEDLELPLSTSHQFQTLTLAVQHFLEAAWKAFTEGTLGVNLYRGLPPQTEAESEYLDLLATHIPEALPRFYTFDLSTISTLARQAHLVDKEKFPHTHLIVKNPAIPVEGWRYEAPWIKPYRSDAARVGVCLPSSTLPFTSYSDSLEEILQSLKARGLPYRILSESLLTTCWDGLDEIIVIPETLTLEGKRKLQGFASAGGEICYSQQP